MKSHVIESRSRLAQMKSSPISPLVFFAGTEEECNRRLSMMRRNGGTGNRDYRVIPVGDIEKGSIRPS